MRPRRRHLLAILATASVFGCATLPGAGGAADLVRARDHSARIETVAEGLDHPWSLAFLPDRRMLVTERSGRLLLLSPDGRRAAPVAGVPEVAASGQGGLLDVVLHPDFATNRLVYLTFSPPGRDGAATAFGRGRLEGATLEGFRTLYVGLPRTRRTQHYGSRLVFARDGTLYLTAGERGAPDRAQDPGDPAGSILRFNDDGTVPPNNPFVGRAGARPEIYSLGNRNPQGMAMHPGTGRIWAHEHGPRGGDEVNVIDAGANYGWPVITYGMGYDGSKVGIGTHKDGMAQPLWYWVPSIAPSGMAFYTGAAFPKWRGSLFVGALASRILVRLTLDGERVTGEERLLEDLRERIRDVREGPDGYLYLLTDSGDGKLLRLVPE